MSSAGKPLDKLVQLQQRERRRILALASASYGIDCLWMGWLWRLQVVPAALPLVYAAAAGLASCMFHLLLARDWNLRLRDPSMTVMQTGFAYALLVAGLLLAPQAGGLLLLTMFIVAAFSALAMTLRQFVLAWLLVSAAIALAIFRFGGGIAMPAATPQQVVVSWLVFVSVFGRVVLLSLRIGSLRDQLIERNHALRDSLERIERLASVDDLTQAWNRRAIGRMIDEEGQRSARSGAPFCMVMFDLDHFKAVNDRCGHQVGDAVLRRFATITLAALRATDRLGRWGGEEFLLLLPATRQDGGLVIAERVRAAVEAEPWELLAPELRVTVSGGIAESLAEQAADAHIARCDVALYMAKNGGRNRIVVHPPIGGAPAVRPA